jgi:hypothetical protein
MAKKKSGGKSPAKKTTQSRKAKSSTKLPALKKAAKKAVKKSSSPKKSSAQKPSAKKQSKKVQPVNSPRKAKVFDSYVDVPNPKKKRKTPPRARPISKRELPVKYHGLARTLVEIEKNSDKINKLKRPGEKWAFEIDGIRSWATFNHIDHFAQYLRESEGVRHLFRRHKQAEQFWRALKLVRWNGTATEWKPSAQKLNSTQLARKKRNAAKEAKRRRR